MSDLRQATAPDSTSTESGASTASVTVGDVEMTTTGAAGVAEGVTLPQSDPEPAKPASNDATVKPKRSRGRPRKT